MAFDPGRSALLALESNGQTVQTRGGSCHFWQACPLVAVVVVTDRTKGVPRVQDQPNYPQSAFRPASRSSLGRRNRRHRRQRATGTCTRRNRGRHGFAHSANRRLRGQSGHRRRPAGTQVRGHDRRHEPDQQPAGSLRRPELHDVERLRRHGQRGPARPGLTTNPGSGERHPPDAGRSVRPGRGPERHPGGPRRSRRSPHRRRIGRVRIGCLGRRRQLHHAQGF